MDDYGGFKIKEDEMIRPEGQGRFEVIMNGLALLGKKIPWEEITMKILGVVSWQFQPKVTAMQPSPLLDILDTLQVFFKLEQFETKILSNKRSSQPPISELKNLALATEKSKPDSE